MKVNTQPGCVITHLSKDVAASNALWYLENLDAHDA